MHLVQKQWYHAQRLQEPHARNFRGILSLGTVLYGTVSVSELDQPVRAE